MRKLFAGAVALVMLAEPMLAVDGKKAEYVGGTWGQFEQGVEGKLDLTDANKAIFIPSNKKKGAQAEIPFGQVTSLEYGQKAGRRVGVAIMISPLALFSKKRKHYLTVGFTNAAGKTEGVVLELGKDITRGTLTTFEARSGKQIEYESEDAKKNVGN